MIRLFLVILAIILIAASCSSPRHTYHFDHYNYNSGRKNSNVDTPLPNETSNGDKNPLTLDNRALTASKDKNIFTIPDTKMEMPEEKAVVAEMSNNPTTAEVARNHKELSKEQRKEFRKAMREDMRRYVIPSKKIQ